MFDPRVRARFAWGDEVDMAQFMSDPALRTRLTDSYIDDPDYRPPAVAVTNVLIDGPLGKGSLPLRVYAPEGPAEPRRALVWAHGGGFVAGGLDDQEADGVARELVARAGVVVVSVGYHTVDGIVAYPSLHRELRSAFAWTRAQAATLGVDPEGISLGGASAGASLALAATLEAADRSDALPASLVPVYPALHDLVPEHDDEVDMSQVPILLRFPPEATQYMFTTYRGSAADAPYAVPDGHDLTALPRTLVLAAEYDDLRGSAHAFTQEATRAGIEVTEIVIAGAAHGFLAMSPGIAATEHGLRCISDYLSGR